MSRTRRRIRPPDDPRNSRRLRQESGVNLMHEEPWFGFNVADKLPIRNDADPSGNPFLGLDRRILASQTLTEAEQADNSTTNRVLAPNAVLNGNIGEQINATHLPNLVGLNGDLPIDRTTGQLPASRLSGNLPMSQVSGNLDGGRIQKKSIPSDAIHALHGSKITGKSSIPWSMIDVAHVVFTRRLNEELARLWRRAEHTFQKKP